MRVAVAASALALLVGSGCAPIWGTYTRIEVPDAKYFGRKCGGSVGPKSVAYFPYHGIFLSIDIDSSIRFGINVPSGMTAELLGRTIHISGRTESGPIEFKATMVPTTTTGIFGSAKRPESMPFFTRGYRDPAANSFGPFKGETSKEKDNQHIWYMFSAFDESETPRRLVQVPRGLVSGTIELPTLAVNGQRFGPQKLPFSRDSYFDISPVNC